MHCWFLLAGNDPEKLRAKFINFFYNLNFPRGMALWKWKKTCWICSPENHKNDILTSFVKYGIVEFSSAPSPSDIEFIYGDDQSLNSLSQALTLYRTQRNFTFLAPLNFFHYNKSAQEAVTDISGCIKHKRNIHHHLLRFQLPKY